MTPAGYRIILEGKIAAGREIEEVKRNLNSLFDIDQHRLERLFTGEPFLIKKDVDYQTAMKYKDALERAGAVCRVEACPRPDRPQPFPVGESPADLPSEVQLPLDQQSRGSLHPLGGSTQTQRIPLSPIPGQTTRRYSIVHPLVMSFFSKDFYRDVGRNWKGFPFAYLFFILLLFWIPRMITLQYQINDFVDSSAREFLAQIPRITIFRGEVSIDEEEPYFIKDPENGEIFAIIDTTGYYTSLNEGTVKILVTKKKAILKKSRRETRTFDLSEIDNFVLDQDLIAKWISIFKKWFVFVLFPLAVLSSFLYRTVQALVYATIGILFTKTVKTRLSFPSLMNIAIMAVTPVLILDTILVVTKISIPLWNLWCFIIAMGFLYYGVEANREQALSGGINSSVTDKA